MIDEIHATPPAPDTFSDVANSNTDGPKKSSDVMAEDSNVQNEETSNVDLAEEADHNEEASNVQAEETAPMESAQRGYEANAESPPAQDEPPGSILDILG